LRYVLVTEPAYHNVKQFLGDLRSLSGIISLDPDLEDIEAATEDLWLGKLIWKEFVVSLRGSLNLSKEQAVTSEKKGMSFWMSNLHLTLTNTDDQNPFNTLEARLVFEGYVRRGNMDLCALSAGDDILWEKLNQIGPQEHWPVWKWVTSEIMLRGATVAEVLKKAGAWWRDFRYQQGERFRAISRSPAYILLVPSKIFPGGKKRYGEGQCRI
jgi:hypothetical protein